MPDSARDVPYVALSHRLGLLARLREERPAGEIPWKDASKPQPWFNESFMQTLGIDTTAVAARSSAAELLQWTLALATCRELRAAKRALLAFLEREQTHLGDTSGLRALEQRGLELFERYEEHLLEGADDRIEAFARSYRVSSEQPEFLDSADSYPSPAALHYSFWLHTLFASQYAGLLAHRLQGDSNLQPTWRAVLAEHAVLQRRCSDTALAYLHALNLPEDDKQHWSRAFFFHLCKAGSRFLGTDAAQQILNTRHPELVAFPGGLEFKGSAFLRLICDDPLFEALRQSAPHLQALRLEMGFQPSRAAVAQLDGLLLESRKEQSLVDLLVKATKGSGKLLLRSSEGEEILSPKSILRDAEHHLLILRRLGLDVGQPVLIQLSDPRAFLTAFWGCLLGGYVPVPLTPPRALAALPENLDRVAEVAALLEQPPLVTDALSARACAAHQLGRAIKVLAWEELAAEGRSKHRPRTSPGKGADDALIRVSAGRTGKPHCAVLSHNAVLANLGALRQALEVDEKDVFFCSFPLSSPRGLFGCHLLPLALGANQCFASAHELDAQDWWEAVKKQRATVLACPADDFPKPSDAKLHKRVQRIDCGPGHPDPVLEAHLDGLTDKRFELYGLAEAGFALTLEDQPGLLSVDVFSFGAAGGLRQVDASSPQALALYSKGKPLPGVELRVVDALGKPLPELSLGEVQARGPGFARRLLPEEANLDAEAEWLHAGDLGTLAGGHLYLAGPLHDVLFAGGRNFVADDLERQGRGIPGLDGCWVLSARDPLAGHEQVVLVAALRDTLGLPAQTAVLEQLTRLVSERLAFPVDAVFPLNSSQLPRGPHGDVLRWKLKERYNLGELSRGCSLLPLAEIAAETRRIDRRTPMLRLAPPLPKQPRHERRRTDRRKGARREVDRRRRAAARELGSDLLEAVRQLWAEVLSKDTHGLGVDSNFMEVGGNAHKANQLHGRLEETFGVRLDRRALAGCSTVREMAGFLHRSFAAPSESPRPDVEIPQRPIAIISIAGRLPGARNVWDFWRLLKSGRSAIGEIPETRWNPNDFYDPSPLSPGKTSCRRGAFLAGIEDFDPGYFDVSFESARHMDPQQRLFLEVAYEALRKGGLHRPGFTRDIGVYVGVGPSEYFHHYLERNEAEALADTPAFSGLSPEVQAELLRQLPRGAKIRPQTAPGNLESMVAHRVSQVLGLCGPSLALNTAGSSALIALHLACEALQRNECAMAVAGGVSVNLTVSPYLLYSQAGLLSGSGEYRPYSALADGMIPGEGAGAVLLKPLDRALADGDTVWGIVRGSAVTHDGKTAGATQPSLQGLEEALRRAYSRAKLEPAAVSYIEGQGSALPEADRAELQVLQRVLSEGSWQPGACMLGSVKPNVGHLMAAAGMAGLLKILLAMHFREIPRTLHLASLREDDAAAGVLDLEGTPLSFAERHRSWPARNGKRIAGITAWGVGGVNCHAVIEAPTRVQISHPAPQLVCLQAKSLDYFNRNALGITKLLRRRRLPFGLVCANLNRAPGRDGVRAALLGSDPQALEEQLSEARDRVSDPGPVPRLVLVLGNAPLDFSAAAELHGREPYFRTEFDGAWALLDTELEAGAALKVAAEQGATPALRFCFGYALARLLEYWGVRCDGVIGCGRSEWLAAVLTGLWPLELGLALAQASVQFLEGGGGRLRISADANRQFTLLAELDGELGVSAYLSGEVLELSGTGPAVDQVLERCKELAVDAQRLEPDARLGSGARQLVAEELAKFSLGGLATPLYSTLRGRRAEAEELDSDYWTSQVGQPVQFYQALEAARHDGASLFLDFGLEPGWRISDNQLSCFPDGQVSRAALLRVVGRLFEAGLPIDSGRLSGATPLAAPLPGSPFGRVRCWLFDQPSRERPPSQPLHPLVSEQVSGGDTEVVFIKRFAEEEYYLRDHTLHGRGFMPTAAFIEMVLGAARLSGEAVGLRQMSIVRPLFAGNQHDSKVHIHLVGAPNERRFSVVSQTSGGDTWMEHFSGQVVESDPAESQPPRAIDIRALKERCSVEVPVQELYRSLEAGGLHIGSSMQCLETLRRSEREVFASLRLPDNAPDGTGYILHPALLDASLVAICALTFERMPPGVVLLGFGIGEMLVHARLHGPCLVHVERKSEFDSGSEVIRCDVHVVSENGHHLVDLKEVCLKRSKRSEAVLGCRLFEIAWQEAPIGLPVEHAHPVLLFADPGGVWAELKWPLRLAGTRVVVAYPGKGFEHLGDGQFTIDLDEPSHYDALFAALKQSGVLIRSVWHLGYFGDEPREEGAGKRFAALRGLFLLSEALERAGYRQVELNVLNNQSVSMGPHDPERTAVWGFLRFLASKPNVWTCRGLDLPLGQGPSELAGLILAEWSSSGTELLVCYRDGKRFVPVLQPKDPARDPKPALRERGTYWLTHGPGGLSSVLARYLARTYKAKVLFTLGRDLTPEEDELCLELKTLGGDVLFVRADITQPGQLAEALHRAETRWGAISGVFHSAAIEAREPGNWQELLTQLDFKAGSAEILADLFRNRDIDFLCLFSSVLSLVGLQGNAAHAVADSFLNAFARREHDRGRPVLASVWSDWEAGGALGPDAGDEAPLRGNVSEFGLVPIPSESGLQALERVLGLGHPHSLVVCVQEGHITQLQEAFRQAHFAPSPTAPETAREASQSPPAAPGLVRKERPRASWSLERTVLQLVGVKLQRPAREIDPDTLFVELGLDSLSALDVVSELEKLLDISLYPTLLFEHRTAREVAGALEEFRSDKTLGLRKKTLGGEAWLQGRLSKRQLTWKQSCRQFAREAIAPHAELYDRQASFPEKAHDQAAALGFLNLGFDEELGGRGSNELDLALAIEEMAAACASITLCLSLNHVALQPVLRAGGPAQQKKFLARLLARRGYAALAFDPVLGATSTAVRALKGEEGWVLSSLERLPVANGDKAELFLVLAQARVDDADSGPSLFAVPRQDGVVLEPPGERMGLRCLGTPRLHLHSVEIEDDHLLGPVGGAAEILGPTFDRMRFLTAICQLGIAVGALRQVMAWLRRDAHDLLDLNPVKLRLAELYRGVRQCRLQIWRTARLLEHGLEASAEIADATLQCSELSVRATEAVLRLFARKGLDSDLAAQKRFRDARVFTLPSGPAEAAQLGLFDTLLEEVERDGLL